MFYVEANKPRSSTNIIMGISPYKRSATEIHTDSVVARCCNSIWSYTKGENYWPIYRNEFCQPSGYDKHFTWCITEVPDGHKKIYLWRTKCRERTRINENQNTHVSTEAESTSRDFITRILVGNFEILYHLRFPVSKFPPIWFIPFMPPAKLHIWEQYNKIF